MGSPTLMKWEKHEILITGAQGYIGPELAKFLKASSVQYELFGVDVAVCFDQITEDNCDNIWIACVVRALE